MIMLIIIIMMNIMTINNVYLKQGCLLFLFLVLVVRRLLETQGITSTQP